MAPITLLVSDVDRTLLTHDYVLRDDVASALARLRAAGVQVVLATARSPEAVRPYAERLGATGLAICFNGGWIGDLDTGEAHVSTPVPRDDALAVMAAAQEIGVVALWYGAGGVSTTGEHPLALREAKITGENLRVVDGLADLPGEPGKIMCVRADPDDDTGFAAMRLRFFDSLAVAGSHPRLLEIGPQGVSKRAAVEWVARHLGADQASTAAAGDAENDLDMLHWAGTRLTVENGIDEVKRIADFVAPSCDAGGLAVAVDWLMGERMPIEPTSTPQGGRRNG
ncbi:Cof subfamily protein (haloacid dehalogenase superfamily) [Shinella sp. BE166]|uniref:Cof-type HAD-IIB family hydrolase n=1 Tax=Shinella sp. BE166 TaxID=3373918 RepID=UPI003EB695AA